MIFVCHFSHNFSSSQAGHLMAGVQRYRRRSNTGDDIINTSPAKWPSKYRCTEEDIIPYKWVFSRVPNFRFIRDSHRSTKKRIRVNFHHFF